jgi:hypothetical protein
MRNMGRWLIGLAILAGFGFASWALVSSNAEAQIEPDEEPVHLEQVENTDLSRVILSERAVQRLDIKTAEIEQMTGGTANQKVIPYSAVLYDAEGNTWTFVSPEERVYVRARIEIDHIKGDQAVLSEGPEVGTQVVATGAAELFGAEVGVGH